jgi:hypothetical protein
MRLPSRLLALIAAIAAAGGLAAALLWPSAEPQPPRILPLAGFTEGPSAATGDGPGFFDGFLKQSAGGDSPRFFRPFIKGASGGGAPTLVSIDVTPDATTWRPTASADRQQMVATGTYSDLSTADITADVTWTSGTEAVATISNGEGTEGEVTPLTVGPTLITATLGAVSGDETLTLDVDVDATSGKGVPSTAFQWLMVGLTIDSAWLAQEASGNLAGYGPSAFTLTANGTPLYQQAVTGWTRTASAFNQVAAQRFGAAAGVGPNPASTSVLWFGYMVADTLPSAVRGMLNAGGNVGVGLVNGSGNLRLYVNAVTVDDSTTLPPTDNLVHPIVVKVDNTGSAAVLYTDEAKTVGTYAAATDGTKGFGGGIFSASPPALSGVLLGAVASGANAELTDAQIKTILENLHWSPPWS